MLVLDGAPLDRTATGALWAAFAGGGRHRAAVGRLVVVPSVAEPLLAAVAAARRSCAPATRGVLRPRSARCARPRPASAGRGARRRGGRRRRRRCCAAARSTSRAWRARSTRPRCCAACRRTRGCCTSRSPARCWPWSRPATEEEAIALAAGAPARLGLGGDRARGERVARTLGAEVAWVNEHGHSIPGAAVRLAATSTRAASPPSPRGLRSARWLPYDPALVRASTATARLQHGRENERLGRAARGRRSRSPAPRSRLAREALGR